MMTENRINILKIIIQSTTIGYLIGYRHGKNVFTFDKDYLQDENRLTFSMRYVSEKTIAPLASYHRLPQVFSNLLPEGALRDMMTQTLKSSSEFVAFASVGHKLPGGIIATPIMLDELPNYAYGSNKNITPAQDKSLNTRDLKFSSLAGVQLKFSAKKGADNRYNINLSEFDDWIIKTPSTRYDFVPFNEYTAMTLAKLAGVDVPEIRLVKLSDLTGLPSAIALPNEQYAYAIKRFDRLKNDIGVTRIHTEDFAQVFGQYAQDKYLKANYEKIGYVLAESVDDKLTNIKEMANRLLINILIGNGDAHLKNWSLIYHDGIHASLSPAYDIVSTKVYMENEKNQAFKLGKEKHWYSLSMAHFQQWAMKISPEQGEKVWQEVKQSLLATMDIVRDTWPDALYDLPMDERQKDSLKAHMASLHDDFKVDLSPTFKLSPS